MAKQFPNVPEDVSGLSDDELQRLLDQSQAAVDDLGEDPDPDRYDEIDQGLNDRERVLAEVKVRSEKKAEQAERMKELLSRAKGDSDDDESDAEGDPEGASDEDADEDANDDPEADGDSEDAEKDEQRQPIAASGARRNPARAHGTGERKRILVAKPEGAGQRSQIGPALEGTPATLVASADVPGVALGSDLTEPLRLAEAMASRFHNLGTASVAGDKVPVAQVKWGYPEERTLHPGAERSTLQKIRQAVGRAPIGRAPADAILASGGLCAPVEIRYDLPVLAQADRPVRDSLPSFNAVRGGIRYAAPPSLASITTAVGRVTATQDAGGATKACQVIACPSFIEVDVAAIYHCLQFGNLGARAYPELVENATELTLAAQARLAETALLDAMKAASTHAVVNLTPSTTAPLGANAILLPALLRAAAAIRSRQRMDPEATLDVQMPAWTLDLLTSDLARSAFDRFSANDANLIQTMQSYGLRVNFYWDGTTGGVDVFGAQTAGAALLEFPPKLDLFMYPAGSFLFLDGGALDIGLVRDSVLNHTNDYQIFGETWENLAFTGLESLWIEVNVCDTGAVAAAVQSVCGS